MKILLPILLLFAGVANAAPLTLGVLESGEISNYKIEEISDSWKHENQPKVFFNDLYVHTSKRYQDVQSYINAQTYAPEYIRKALSVHAFMLEFLMQNANEPEKLTASTELVSNIDVCLYFPYDDSVRFIQDRMLRMLTKDDVTSTRLKNSIAFLTPKVHEINISEHELKLQIVGCSELVNKLN